MKREAALFSSPSQSAPRPETTSRRSPQPLAVDQHETNPRRNAARLSGSPTTAQGTEEETATERSLRLQVALLTRELDAARRVALGDLQPKATGQPRDFERFQELN